MGKSIGVISLKGGVGKTSVVATLGTALANLDKKVLLVDGNFSAPNLGLHFKMVQPDKTLHHILDREVRAKDAIYNLDNLDVIPASIFTDKKINPLKLKDRLKRLKKNYDYIIYDSSPRLDEETLGVMMASDIIFVVTTPDHPTLSTTLKAVKVARENGTPIAGLIINKVYNKKFEISIEDIEGTIDVPVMAVIPHDIAVLKALSEFDNSLNYKPHSKVSKEFMKLALALVGEKEKKGFSSFFRRYKPKKQEINRLVLYKSVFI